MQMPEGWQEFWNLCHWPPGSKTIARGMETEAFMLNLLREMAEALEFYDECNTCSKGYDHGALAGEVLKKFRSWK